MPLEFYKYAKFIELSYRGYFDRKNQYKIVWYKKKTHALWL